MLFSERPNWIIATQFARSTLYAAFVMGGAFTLVSNQGPRQRDGRAPVVAAALGLYLLYTLIHPERF